jgi:phage shock protein A
MGWEIKTLQKTKETLKHDMEKLEKEIITLESQKKSVIETEKKRSFILVLN